MDLHRVDLNLMVAFEALLEARSVSVAALRLGVSQPAMSSTLARLRTLFDDELLVRSGRDMLPTVRALELQVPVAHALAQLRAALDTSARFDPASSSRAFSVSGGDYAATIILPRLAARMERLAPSIDLRFRFVEKDQVTGLLDAEKVDLALGVFPGLPKRFASRGLFKERFVCVARAGHEALRDGMTLQAFAGLRHVLVTERGDATGVVDEALRRHGLQRRIALTVPYVLVLRALLAEGDLVATVGRRAACMFAATMPLGIYDPPVEMPAWQISMLWSRQRGGDAGLAWLRQLLVSVSAEV